MPKTNLQQLIEELELQLPDERGVVARLRQLEIDSPTNGASSSFPTVQDEGSALTLRGALNFVGAGVTAADDAANGRTVITVPGATGGGAGRTIAPFGFVGPVSVQTGTARFLFPSAATILGVVAAVGTAPMGQSMLVDVLKNGTTVFTTQANRPTIAAGAHATSVMPTPDVTAVVSGDYLTVDIDQIGSTVAGSDLVVNVYLSVT